MKSLKRFIAYLKGNGVYVVFLALFALLSVVSKMAIPFVSGLAIQEIIDAVQETRAVDISLHLILIASFIVSGALFRYLFDVMTNRLGQKVVKNMRDQAFEAINHASVSFIDTHYHGDLLLCLVNDIENVQTGLIVGAGALYEGIVQILVTLVFMFMLNWVMAIAIIVLTPISIFVSRFISSHNSRYYKEQNAKTGKLTAYSLESLNNLEAVRAYGLEESKEAEFDEINAQLKDSSFRATFAVSWINPMTRLVNNTIYAILALIGGVLIITKPGLGLESFGPGALSAMLSYAYQYMAPFNEVSNVASEVSYALASFKRIDDLITSPKDIDEGKEELSSSVDSLEAKHINFSYDGKRQIIKDFNIDIYKGHKIAFVGPTGCGKTTIINLLLRFYDPQSGAFAINGKEATMYPKKELRKHIGMVLQDSWLFHGTIRENIGYGRLDATFDDIKAAAKKAHADSFIRQLPNGYDTLISNQSGLSTGQKQLLCLARVMLMEPEVVVLDEATSNIDLRTEFALSESFDELMKGKTSLVVAHRLSTIQNADLILVLKDGEIIEMGNFNELMEKKGFFKELYDSQLA
ncbi:MAG: ABC transporter ATP-binding protein [Candidatus Enteromonas sp.]|nr:ABC transporter ATP-binding protein [Candidatus Enteromonas sp.]